MNATTRTEIARRDADWQAAVRDANDPNLSDDERACARKAADEHVAAVLDLIAADLAHRG